jgi:hypothetical protein
MDDRIFPDVRLKDDPIDAQSTSCECPSLMGGFHRKLLLHCDIVNSRFTLAMEGEDWRQTFDTFDDAYEEAEAHASEVTPLVLYNERGQVMAETTVSPLPSELVSFRYPLKGDGDHRKG